MRISQKDLKLILKEALELSPGNKEKTIAALKQKIGAEGGAMGGAEAKETAETESGVTMSDDDFEELASSVGIETHDDGDVVDTTGLAEGNKMKITKKQLRQIIKEELNSTVNESVTDMYDMNRLIGDHAGQITDAFGADMSKLWDEDPAMMKRQGYTNRSQTVRARKIQTKDRKRRNEAANRGNGPVPSGPPEVSVS